MDIPLVDCDRRRLRLTEKSCAAFWRQSNPVAPPAWQGRHACHQCPAGALRCGTSVSPYQADQARIAAICPRCCNPAERFIGGRLCKSCYNRAAEVRRGYDRKGAVPGLTGRLGAVSFQVIRNGRPERATLRGVTGMIEAAMTTARQSLGPVGFARAPFAL